MKKIVAGMLLLMLFLLMACSGQSSESVSTEDNGNSRASDSSSQEGQQAAEAIELTIASVWPGPHGQHVQVVEPLMEEIEKVTEGRITATLYPAGGLGAPSETYDMTVTGIADIGYGLHNTTPGVFHLVSVNSLPFIGDSAINGTEISNALLETFSEEFEAEHDGTKIAYLWIGDGENVFTVDKPIHKPEDLQGLRISLTPSPTGNAFLEAFGAIPVTLPMGEVYEAMQRGIVDGALANGSTIPNFQLGDVAGHITRLNLVLPTFFCVINEDTWSQISTDDQAALEELFAAYGLKHAEAYDSLAEEGWRMAEEKGVEIFDIPEEEKHLWGNPLQPVADEWIESIEAMGLPGREVYEEVLRLKETLD
ncbi:TRAP transporter substrate-binding protein [Alkalihalobacillus oceani]|uniref:TRAP transporter substrate-binding protein n=1 Tax=Halalkalibacter oceani TaxID=1653776 RepID=A0A9X2ILZ2_9BACI|nr:TRAP transporter substrate-binding protein [Halalkalibacter oceani]MCM3713359.1 TRAP transporter substrate-binding protein [Halalkalibacter oceani]